MNADEWLSYMKFDDDGNCIGLIDNAPESAVKAWNEYQDNIKKGIRA